MAFAAIVHGANGMAWFHYSGEISDPKKSYSGIFRTQDDWNAMTNLVRQIRAISPVLLERTPSRQPSPEIVSGPLVDSLGQVAVSALLKEHCGVAYLFAVNAAAGTVRARFRLEMDVSEGNVEWEGRKVSVVNGTFEDDFEPLGVHVYRFAKGEKNAAGIGR